MATPKRRKPVIGILGGMGSGKSLVAQQFARLGCGVIDADELAAQVLREPPVKEKLVEWWGPEVLDGSGTVDRRQLAGRVFNNRAELDRLELLVHPRVHDRRKRLHEKHQADPGVVAVVEDTPLLVEKGLDEQCDVLVFVESTRKNRLERLAKSRGWDARELDRREKNQVGLDIKAARADYVVDNNADPQECFAHVSRVLSQILHDDKQD